MHNATSLVLADARWHGTHGIGRFSFEVISRLKNKDILHTGPKPLSLKNLVWLPYQLNKNKKKYHIYFNPSFNPILYSPIPYVFTIHDLIHLSFPGKAAKAKYYYYQHLIKPAIKNAKKIITVSNYSKEKIINWTNIDAEKILVVGSGVGKQFTANGDKHSPGYPYLLHVGNNKPHKNIIRLITAFANAKIDCHFRLILTCQLTSEIHSIIAKFHLVDRVIFTGTLSDEDLATYYRGAYALVFPSLEEGFGLPPLEAMSCGIPVITSNISSLPEITGNAALFCNPYDISSITNAIESVIDNTSLRVNLIAQGFARIKLFTWDKTASLVQNVL